jgi:glycerophosphoryl diester phosphodiesterase
VPASPWPFLDHPGSLAFAHRGGASDAPENTMPAFQHAVDMGYRYLETDAHVTADGVLLAFHDDVLDRVTEHTGRVGDLPYDLVREARVGNEPIPLVEDLLSAWPDIRVNIDPKSDAAVEPLAALIDRLGCVDRVCIGSFSDRRLATMRRLVGAALCTSLGPRATARLKAAAHGAPVGRLPAPCAQVPVRQGRVVLVDERIVAAAHRRGMQVHVWTIDDPDEMRRLLDLGVDGIMTDRPAVLKAVLEERGDWYS